MATEMTPRERFMTALHGGQPDRVPIFEIHWNHRFLSKVLGRRVWDHTPEDEVAASLALGTDSVWAYCPDCQGPPSRFRPGESFLDCWGTTYGTSEDSWPGAWPEAHPVNAPDDWAKLARPDPDNPALWRNVARTAELAQGRLAVVGGVRGPFSAVWMLAGLVNISYFLYDAPDVLAEMFDALGRWYTRVGLHMARAGADVIMIHDDYGSNQNTFISPEDWRRLVLPAVGAQIHAYREAGIPVIWHSDGNLNRILDDMVAVGVEALNPVQRSAGMNLAEVRQRYDQRLCLIGNVDATTTLPHRSPAEVEREVLACLRDAAPGGAYILAPDHSFHSAVPDENIRRFLEVGRRYGRYPLDVSAIEAALAA